MKFSKFWKAVLFSFVLVSVSPTLWATPPENPPPRGRAYGYYLHDGGYVLFVYLENDGSRLIELSKCRQHRYYLISKSTDLVDWTPLATVEIGAEGTASALDPIPASHCFYTVTRAR
jgi:hypothetical protein